MQAIDERGTRDTTEFWNVSKDDAIAWPEVVHRSYPSAVQARIASTIRPFVEQSIEVNLRLLEVFNGKLGLPRGTLAQLHKREEKSGCLSRCIRAPPRSGPPEKLFIPAHTDYGSLVLLLTPTKILYVTDNGRTGDTDDPSQPHRRFASPSSGFD